MRTDSFLRGAAVALACILNAVVWAGSSKLCPNANPLVVLDGPGQDVHRLVGSTADYFAYLCSPGTTGCRYTTLSLKAGTFDGGGWVAGPTTLGVGVPLGLGAPAMVAASQTLKQRGEQHVGAISSFGCQGMRFFVQSAPKVTSAAVLTAPRLFGSLGYYLVGENVVLEASGSVDSQYSTDGFARFDWDLGEGQTAAGDVVTATFTKAGEYLPSVVVSDGKFTSAARAVPIWVRGEAQPPDSVTSFRDCEVFGVDFYWERTGTRFELEVYDGTSWVTRYDGAEPYAHLGGGVQGKTVRVRAWDADFGATPSSWVTYQVPRTSCYGTDPTL